MNAPEVISSRTRERGVNGLLAQDLSMSLWVALALSPIAVLLCVHYLVPEWLPIFLAKDVNYGGGFFEWATVGLLVPAITAGTVVLLFYRKLLPSRRLVSWVGFWTLGLLYFAGEEIGWGQHIFNWSTPEWLASINKHEETGLHNISSWFHQKPALLAEIWVFVGGLVVPVIRLWHQRDRGPTTIDWRSWFWASPVCIVPAAVVFVERVCDTLVERTSEFLLSPAIELISESELSEFSFALFFAAYMLSLWMRLRFEALYGRLPRRTP